MRTSVPIQVIVHFPPGEEGKQQLARQVSELHAEGVLSALNRLNCPGKQKRELLQAILDACKG